METARSRTTRWPPTHCLRICPKRSAERIRSWPHKRQRSQESPRKQWQFQENSLVKHFRPCGELAAGVRQPVRPSADVTREEDFGGKSGGAEVEVRREVSCAELAQAQNCVVRDSIRPTDGHRRGALLVREAGAALAEAMMWVSCKTEANRWHGGRCASNSAS